VENAQCLQSGFGTPHHSPHPASAWSTPIHAPPHVPALQRRITTPMSGQTPVPVSALHRHPHCATTDHARLPLSGLKALFELNKDRGKQRPPCIRFHVSVQYRWSGFAPWVSAKSRRIKAHISAAEFLCSIKKCSINSIPRLTVYMSASLQKNFPRINSSPRARTKVFDNAYVLFAIRSTSTNY